jgi:hypothetical protein
MRIKVCEGRWKMLASIMFRQVAEATRKYELGKGWRLQFENQAG